VSVSPAPALEWATIVSREDQGFMHGRREEGEVRLNSDTWQKSFSRGVKSHRCQGDR
jgi:hypothetical protein